MSYWLLLLGLIGLMNTIYWLGIMLVVLRVPTHVFPSKNEERLTLIVVFRQALDLLKKNRTAWLRQKLTGMDFLYVQDGGALEKLDLHESERLVYHQKTTRGKKKALQEAFQRMDAEWALLTDVDCLPASPHWAAKSLEAARQQGKKIVLLYGPYFRRPGWLSRSIRFENVVTAWQYFGWWALGRPYMAVGRNVLYHRDICQAFQVDDSKLASGDDDLFFQQIGRADNTGALLDPETFVYSEAPNSLWSWFNQKSRHLTTSTHYKTLDAIILGGVSVTQIFMSILFLWWIFGGMTWLGYFFVGRWFFFYLFGKKAFQRMEASDLYFYFPVLDILHGFYLLIVGVWTLFRSKNKW